MALDEGSERIGAAGLKSRKEHLIVGHGRCRHRGRHVIG
jgi:hypothetical protein